MDKLSGAELIAAERWRQVESEGWDSSHDDNHCEGELWHNLQPLSGPNRHGIR